MNEQLFVVSWTGNNASENYYEIFKDIDNARQLRDSLKQARSYVKTERSVPTSGTLKLLGTTYFYDFQYRDKDPYMEIKTLRDYYITLD